MTYHRKRWWISKQMKSRDDKTGRGKVGAWGDLSTPARSSRRDREQREDGCCELSTRSPPQQWGGSQGRILECHPACLFHDSHRITLALDAIVVPSPSQHHRAIENVGGVQLYHPFHISIQHGACPTLTRRPEYNSNSRNPSPYCYQFKQFLGFWLME